MQTRPRTVETSTDPTRDPRGGGMDGSEGLDSVNGSSCENIAGWVDSQERMGGCA